jgi:lipopolysaccharide export LptBFGC system permease protein LptF
MTASFISGIALGFAYHFVHATCVSLGGAGVIPVLAAAWSAGVIFLCVGLYLVGGAEYAR